MTRIKDLALLNRNIMSTDMLIIDGATEGTRKIPAPVFGGNIFNVKMFGALCDGQAVYDASATASTTSTITSATAAFTSADVGKACVLLAYLDVGIAANRGTITSIIDANNCVATLNASPGAISGATFVWGTDDGAAIAAALTAAGTAQNKGCVEIPVGITLSGISLTVPTGVSFQGIHNNSCGGKAKDFRYYGSSLVLCKYSATPFITMGDSNNDTKGCIIRNMNVDGMNLCATVCTNYNRTTRVEFCTILKSLSSYVYIMAATTSTHDCSFLGSNTFHVVAGNGDVKFHSNIVTGSGANYFGMKLSNTDDIVISNNHFWKDSSLSTLYGGAIQISYNSGSVISGSITIVGNKFDTSFGPHINVVASGNSIGRGLNIIGNHGFQNDNVPAATYPWMSLSIAAGSSLRGLNVHGNLGRASWNNPALGTLTYFIDNSATAGNIYGSSITGNIMDNCAAGYNTLTPTYTAGNMYIAGTGTTVTAF